MLKIPKITIALTILLCIASSKSTDVEEQDNVAVLTDKNFDSFLQTHPLVFVKFYAPWCGHCKSMAPEYAVLAKDMKANTNEIPIAKLDGTVAKEVAERFKIQGYPTLMLFKNGQPIDYKGGRDKESIAKWIYTKASQKPRMLESDLDYEELMNQKLSVLYVIKEGDSKALDEFLTFIMKFDNISFAYSYNTKYAKDFESNSPYTLIVFRNFDDGSKRFESNTGFSALELTENFKKVRFGAVLDYDQDVAEKLQDEKKPVLLVFTEAKESELIRLVKDLAESYKSDFSFALVSMRTESGKKLADHLGVKEEASVRIMGFKNGKNQKYKTNSNSREAIVQLLENYKIGKALQYMKSESIPARNDLPVKVIVGASFNDLVLKNDKFVLLEAYAPWCGACKQLEPVYNELAARLLHVEDLVIAKIDAIANEHPKLETKGFPTIRFYRKGRKDAPLEYKGERTVKAFVSFMEKEMGRKILEVRSEEL